MFGSSWNFLKISSLFPPTFRGQKILPNRGLGCARTGGSLSKSAQPSDSELELLSLAWPPRRMRTNLLGNHMRISVCQVTCFKGRHPRIKGKLSDRVLKYLWKAPHYLVVYQKVFLKTTFLSVVEGKLIFQAIILRVHFSLSGCNYM